MKNLIKIALSGTGLILAMWSTALGYGKQKVVYHINGDNPQQNKGALVNIQNHINAMGQIIWISVWFYTEMAWPS